MRRWSGSRRRGRSLVLAFAGEQQDRRGEDGGQTSGANDSCTRCAISMDRYYIGFDLPKQTFVATATAIALFVDGARVPVYLVTQYAEIAAIPRQVALATAGVTIGTAIASRALGRIPDLWFRRFLALVLAMLGAAMLLKVA